MKKLIFLVLLFLFILAPNIHSAEPEIPHPKVAIIIDDFGGGAGGVKEFLEGDVPITAAVMPFTDKTKEHAELAHKNGFEIMVHLPLQPKKGKPSWLGPNPITVDLPLEEVRRRVNLAIDDVPHAVGINNHMGSLVVENEEIMRVILEVVKERGLYVVDSGTSPKSFIPKLASEMGIPFMERDIFLDDVSSVTHVIKQIRKLAKIAEKKGHAIAIGHVGVTGKHTSAGIFQSVKELKEQDIEVVPASKLIPEGFYNQPFDFWK